MRARQRDLATAPVLRRRTTARPSRIGEPDSDDRSMAEHSSSGRRGGDPLVAEAQARDGVSADTKGVASALLSRTIACSPEEQSVVVLLV